LPGKRRVTGQVFKANTQEDEVGGAENSSVTLFNADLVVLHSSEVAPGPDRQCITEKRF